MVRSFVLGLAVVAAWHSVIRAEAIYGITNLQQLVTFDSVTRTVTANVSPAGFGIGGEFLTSIDVRPATGELYGLSSSNNLYKINPTTGAVTQVGATLSTPPNGSLKAIDFNPTVDRIRVLGSGASPNNLRYHPDTGAFVSQDGDLAFAAGDANAGDTPAIVNGAYTNSFAGAATTTLYDLDAFNDVLATQVPPNNGTLNTVGSLGFDLASSGGFTGFDISGSSGIAYLTGNNTTGGLAAGSLYQVNLATGAATVLGAVSGLNGATFRDIAVVGPIVPEPTAIVLAVGGLVLGGSLMRRRREPCRLAHTPAATSALA
jgi:hypothetical protein